MFHNSGHCKGGYRRGGEIAFQERKAIKKRNRFLMKILNFYKDKFDYEEAKKLHKFFFGIGVNEYNHNFLTSHLKCEMTEENLSKISTEIKELAFKELLINAKGETVTL